MSDIPNVWRAGVRAGLRSLAREPVLGLKRLLLPVSYWRAPEFAYVWRQLSPSRGQRLLDLGSPKDLAAFLATETGAEVVATDILDSAIELSRRYAVAQGIDGDGPGRVRSEVRDGRALPYPDASFDGAFSVSVLEHIPDRGDSEAIRELVRVVRPGGRVVVTTPYDRANRDTFVRGGVYERDGAPNAETFFERHYDERTLKERLLDVPGKRVVDLQIWGEPGFGGERLLSRLGPARTVFSPLEPLLAAAFLRPLANGEARPMAAFFTLEKLAS